MNEQFNDTHVDTQLSTSHSHFSHPSTQSFLYLDSYFEAPACKCTHTHTHTHIGMDTQTHRAVPVHVLLNPYSGGREDTAVPSSTEMPVSVARSGRVYESMGIRGFPVGPSAEGDLAGRMGQISH